ncbi:molybdopterin-dependent oxidoreductase [Acidipila sp. EB88]|uniref:molybdopterin-dependent oxidoreductase n=1 Tax=Acidipila sp. EB88 TaxID=2305226 RepID=UPI001315119F|nr:molybdopterin-dependent oxidoreductase [Acidipila sp. EB88]
MPWKTAVPYRASALAVFLMLGSAHLPAQTPTAMPPSAAPTSPTDGLALSGPAQTITLSLDVLNALPHVTLTVTNGHTHEQEVYSGVPLHTLLEKVGAPAEASIRGKVLSDYIVATGSDNYHAVLSLAEIEPSFHPGQVIVADQVNGKLLDTKLGPLQLVVEEDKKPARSVHNLVKIELKQVE